MTIINPKFLFVQFGRTGGMDAYDFRVMAYVEESRDTYSLMSNGDWVATPEMQVLPEPTLRIAGPPGRMMAAALGQGAKEVIEAIEWRTP